MSGECEDCGEHTLECSCGKWIDVKDRFPELQQISPTANWMQSVDVLYIDDLGIMYVGCLRKNKSGYGWLENTPKYTCCESARPKVTHWMPLPTPPLQ
jgi:hypothetical protein